MKHYKIGSRFLINGERYILTQVNQFEVYLVNVTTGVQFKNRLSFETISEKDFKEICNKEYKLVG